jgi:hypothetical protein
MAEYDNHPEERQKGSRCQKNEAEIGGECHVCAWRILCWREEQGNRQVSAFGDTAQENDNKGLMYSMILVKISVCDTQVGGFSLDSTGVPAILALGIEEC